VSRIQDNGLVPVAPPSAPLDPQGMLVFAALARAKGVRGAAAALGIPRSTVSRRLASLEEALGAQLVVRTTRRFALTDAGALFAVRCNELEALVHSAEDLVRRAVEEPSGTLRVAVAPVLGEEVLPDVIARIVAEHPRLQIDARLSADYVDLRRGTVDVALRAAPLEDAMDLFAVRLGTSVTGCWVSPAYAKKHGVPESPADLAAHACLLVGSASPVRWKFRVGQRDELVHVDGRVRVDSFRVARELAARGTGIFRTAKIFADPLVRAGALVPVLERYWPRVPIFAVHAGPSPAPLKVRAFVAIAREAVARALR
jgi:DNA-binding transcriptional LysR family regulator